MENYRKRQIRKYNSEVLIQPSLSKQPIPPKTKDFTFSNRILLLSPDRGLLRRGRTNPHRPRRAIHPVHLCHCPVPLRLVPELHEPIPLRSPRARVCHNLGPPNRRILHPKRLLQHVIGDIWRQIPDEDRVVGAGVGAALADTEGSPVEAEGLVGAGHLQAIVGLEDGLRGRVGAELDEAVALGEACYLVFDDLYRSHLLIPQI